jgi:peptidoglycan hydrolase-like protein with peptidoglycan-binding domain
LQPTQPELGSSHLHSSNINYSRNGRGGADGVQETGRSKPGAPFDSDNVTKSGFVLALALVLGLSGVESACADDNVRQVQSKLRDGGFYFGEIDGAYSSALAAALTRYQIRNGLPITGQLDADTSKALGAKPAVTEGRKDPAQRSEAWQRLRKRDEQFLARMNTRATPSSSSNVTENGRDETSAKQKSHAGPVGANPNPQQVPSSSSSPTAVAHVSSESDKSSLTHDVSQERLRDYIAAFVLAGLDPHVGAETDFFADRVRYYDDGVIGREKIRQDLQRYDARWPSRRFWLAGDLKVEKRGDNRLQVTFPLRFELSNGSKHSFGRIEKTLALEVTGEDDLQIVEVNERKAD